LCFLLFNFYFIWFDVILIHSFRFHHRECFSAIVNVQNDMTTTFWIRMKLIVNFGMNFFETNEEWRIFEKWNGLKWNERKRKERKGKERKRKDMKGKDRTRKERIAQDSK
jgi:hypothetical protein